MPFCRTRRHDQQSAAELVSQPETAACPAVRHYLQPHMTRSHWESGLPHSCSKSQLPPTCETSDANIIRRHVSVHVATQGQTLQKRLQVSARASLGWQLGEEGSVCCGRPAVTWEWTTGPHRGRVSGEGIMTCVAPHVSPLSLLTAQYTLCPCAPSNHLPTPCTAPVIRSSSDLSSSAMPGLPGTQLPLGRPDAKRCCLQGCLCCRGHMHELLMQGTLPLRLDLLRLRLPKNARHPVEPGSHDGVEA